MEIKDIFLSKEHASMFRKYCKGCSCFYSDIPTKNICTIMRRYPCSDIDTMITYIENCPCQKCLVKAACQDEQCPIWLEYATELLGKI